MNILRPCIKQEGLEDGGELYEMSCFFYALAGIIRLYQGCNIDAFNLILQSIISYISDVVYLGKDSMWHPIDRYFAIYTCVVHFYTLRDNVASFVVNLMIIIIGYNFLVESQELYISDDIDFSVCHVLWHSASIFMALTSNL